MSPVRSVTYVSSRSKIGGVEFHCWVGRWVGGSPARLALPIKPDEVEHVMDFVALAPPG